MCHPSLNVVPTAYPGVLSARQPVGDLVPKSHLRDCFLGPLLVPTVLDQIFECRSFIEECAQQQNLWGNEGSQLIRKKWSYNALVTQTSAIPIGSSVTRRAFQSCPQCGKGIWPLYSCVINHWMCLWHNWARQLLWVSERDAAVNHQQPTLTIWRNEFLVAEVWTSLLHHIFFCIKELKDIF